MIATTLLLTIAVVLALAFWLMGELKFFIPYKLILLHAYGKIIATFFLVLFLNVFAVFTLYRRFFLKDTGRKLSHLDAQFHTGQTELPPPNIDEELP